MKTKRMKMDLQDPNAKPVGRIDVSLDTNRNCEQGKHCTTGAAKALLKVLDKAPDAALAALMGGAGATDGLAGRVTK